MIIYQCSRVAALPKKQSDNSLCFAKIRGYFSATAPGAGSIHLLPHLAPLPCLFSWLPATMAHPKREIPLNINSINSTHARAILGTVKQGASSTISSARSFHIQRRAEWPRLNAAALN